MADGGELVASSAGKETGRGRGEEELGQAGEQQGERMPGGEEGQSSAVARRCGRPGQAREESGIDGLMCGEVRPVVEQGEQLDDDTGERTMRSMAAGEESRTAAAGGSTG